MKITCVCECGGKIISETWIPGSLRMTTFYTCENCGRVATFFYRDARIEYDIYYKRILPGMYDDLISAELISTIKNWWKAKRKIFY